MQAACFIMVSMLFSLMQILKIHSSPRMVKYKDQVCFRWGEEGEDVGRINFRFFDEGRKGRAGWGGGGG